METNLVSLTTASGPYQKFIIEEVLKEAGIPYAIRDGAAPTAWLGAEGPLNFQEFLVPPERLQESKDILCANGVVCEVSERLLSRAVEEILKPLLGTRDRDLARLTRFIEVNNKETVRALLDGAMAEPGGVELIEDVFFQLLRESDVTPLRNLTRALGTKADARFFGRLKECMDSGKNEEKMVVLDILPDLPDGPDRTEILARALRDPTVEVREAAGEALFSLGKGDFGYDAEAPAETREAAIKDFLVIFG